MQPPRPLELGELDDLLELLHPRRPRALADAGAQPRPPVRERLDEALAAADEIGYPCVIKAQVLIGGRGKAGGIKVVSDHYEARAAAQAILGMDIRGHTVHEVWVEAASDIAEEYYASIVFDRSAK